MRTEATPRFTWAEDELDFGDPDLGKAQRRVDLNGQESWVQDEDLGDSYPAAGGGARSMPDSPHLGELSPGGVPQFQAGNEPPRWQPGENLVAWSEDTSSAGRAPGSPWAGGTDRSFAGDQSDATHASHVEGGHDDRQGATGVPPHYTGNLEGPEEEGGGKWPHGGEGSEQAGETSPGASTGVPPSSGAVKSGARPLADHVYALMRENFQPGGIAWVRDYQWHGPEVIPDDDVDTDAVKTWAASHQPERVDHFASRLDSGKHVNPGIAVQEPGESKVKIIDGHHRYLAAKKSGKPYLAYVAEVDRNGGPWDETHSYQLHQGSDPANKSEAWESEARNLRGEWTSGGEYQPAVPGKVPDALPVGKWNQISLNLEGVDPGLKAEVADRVRSFIEKFPVQARTLTSITAVPSDQFPDGERTMADSTWSPGGTSAIRLNLKYYASAADMAASLELQHRYHEHPMGGNRTQAVIDHELGHVIDSAGFDGTMKSLPSTRNIWHIQKLLESLGSSYALGNHGSEAFAEGFSIWEARQDGIESIPLPTPMDHQFTEISKNSRYLASFEKSQSPSSGKQGDIITSMMKSTCRGFVSDDVIQELSSPANKHFNPFEHRNTRGEWDSGDGVPSSSPALKPLAGAPSWAHPAGFSIEPGAADEEAQQGVRQEVRKASWEQAHFIPNLVAQTHITVKPVDEKGTLAYSYTGNWMEVSPSVFSSIRGDKAQKAADWNNKHNYWPGADPGHSGSDQVISHEFGHGVAEAISTHLSGDLQDSMWRSISSAIGTSPPSPGSEDAWVRKNRKSISRLVSKYATEDAAEFQAELWSEYTMKASPRPPAKAFGDFVMRYLPDREARP